ncbi:MAG: metal ABC transporter ATP-binding protein [SAR202 cluster bacterium]|nr:metal ABC transporter ATP-binding protein [SAR202 cluster bacterium]
MTQPKESLDSSCLEFSNVTYRYGSVDALSNVSFNVEAGDFFAVMGPNGSGKTTLVRLALGLANPTAGEIRLFGVPASKFDRWDMVGYVPQTMDGIHTQFPATVREIVAHGLYKGFDPFGFWRRGRQEVVERSLEVVGIEDLADRRISAVSVGQQQRALIARSLVRRPKLLVLDEPEAGVDAAGQEQLYSVLRRLNTEQGITILMVSHDIGAVLQEAKTVACINRTVVFHGPPHHMTQKEISDLYGLPMDVLLHDLMHEHR